MLSSTTQRKTDLSCRMPKLQGHVVYFRYMYIMRSTYGKITYAYRTYVIEMKYRTYRTYGVRPLLYLAHDKDSLWIQ